MLGDDEFLNSVPSFLRRESRPDRPRAAKPAAAPAAAKAPTTSPPVTVQSEKKAARPPAPPPANEKPAAAETRAEPTQSDQTRGQVPSSETAPPAPVMGRPELVADNGRRVEPDDPVTPKRPKAGGDAPFQVTLPRDLIRQIRVRAAEEDTTHRAIILRALKLYGFSIPEGEDIDRRKAIARRG